MDSISNHKTIHTSNTAFGQYTYSRVLFISWLKKCGATNSIKNTFTHKGSQIFWYSVAPGINSGVTNINAYSSYRIDGSLAQLY